MFLQFFGRGAGFADEHTSAYFVTDKRDLFLLDCPCSTFSKVKNFDLSGYNDFYVLITHTHGDHIGGLGLWIQYCFFVLQKKVTVLAPSDEVKADIETVLTIEGNETDWYNISVVNPEDDKPSYGQFLYIVPIATTHSPQLEGKCFGYYIENTYYKEDADTEDHFFIYTGDTSTLKPFEEYFSYASEMYVDTSVFYGQIHLKLEDALPALINLTKDNEDEETKGMKIYLMHLDDVDAAEKIIKDIPGIEIVTLS